MQFGAILLRLETFGCSWKVNKMLVYHHVLLVLLCWCWCWQEVATSCPEGCKCDKHIEREFNGGYKLRGIVHCFQMEIIDNQMKQFPDGYEMLNLASNKLTMFPSLRSLQNTSFRYINLMDNRISKLPTSFPPSIVSINLAFNKIKGGLSSANFTSAYKNITRLYLYNNEIDEIAEGTFVNLPNLDIIDLEENKLVKLKIDMPKKTPFQLIVNGNPINCIEAGFCIPSDSRWLIGTCYTPANMRGKLLSEAFSKFCHPCYNTANPCKNAGVCVPTTSNVTYHCNCIQGFHGQHCQKSPTTIPTTSTTTTTSMDRTYIILLVLHAIFIASKLVIIVSYKRLPTLSRRIIRRKSRLEWKQLSDFPRLVKETT